MRTLLFCIIFLFGSVFLVYADNPKDELKGVKNEIRAQKKLISKTRKVEEDVSTEILQINHTLAQKVNDLGKMDKELLGVEANLDRTGRDILRVTIEANRKRVDMERRLVSTYKAGEIGALRMFFSAESFPQLAENIRYMRSILDNDKKVFAEYNQKIDELRKLKLNLEQDVDKKEHIKKNISLKKEEIEQEKNKKAAYLLQVRQNRSSYEKSLKELQGNASRLQTMISKLEAMSRRKVVPSKHIKPGMKSKPLEESAPVPDKGFASQKGRLSMPVRGQIVESYGKHKHPEFNSYTFSKGVSIAAATGNDIKSIYDGSVIFADSFKGFGNMIIVDHGGGYFSLYAHAAKLLKKVGAEVSKHETIATVGDTDSSKGSMLYFEIRHQGKPVDPAGWVR